MANYAQNNYYAGQAAAQAGEAPITNTNHPEYSYWIQGYNDYNKQQSTSGGITEMMSGMSEMFAPMEFPEIPEVDYDKIIKEQRDTANTSRRDTLFSGYMTAAESAVDYINNQINEERSNAALLGIDYQLTDEMKQQRINKYFDSLWGAGDELELDNLIKDYGNPTGFDGTWTIRRTTDEAADADAPVPYEGLMLAGGPIKSPVQYAGLAPEDRNARPIPQNALIVEYGGLANNPMISPIGSRGVAGANKTAATTSPVGPVAAGAVKPSAPIAAGGRPIASTGKPTTGILATGKSGWDDTSLLGKRTTLG